MAFKRLAPTIEASTAPPNLRSPSPTETTTNRVQKYQENISQLIDEQDAAWDSVASMLPTSRDKHARAHNTNLKTAREKLSIAKTEPTEISVFGPSGSGKSHVVNCLLNAGHTQSVDNLVSFSPSHHTGVSVTAFPIRFIGKNDSTTLNIECVYTSGNRTSQPYQVTSLTEAAARVHDELSALAAAEIQNVSIVSVTYNFPLLIRGRVRLVDLPGVPDSDHSRQAKCIAATQYYFDTCKPDGVILILSPRPSVSAADILHLIYCRGMTSTHQPSLILTANPRSDNVTSIFAENARPSVDKLRRVLGEPRLFNLESAFATDVEQAELAIAAQVKDEVQQVLNDIPYHRKFIEDVVTNAHSWVFFAPHILDANLTAIEQIHAITSHSYLQLQAALTHIRQQLSYRLLQESLNSLLRASDASIDRVLAVLTNKSKNTRRVVLEAAAAIASSEAAQATRAHLLAQNILQLFIVELSAFDDSLGDIDEIDDSVFDLLEQTRLGLFEKLENEIERATTELVEKYAANHSENGLLQQFRTVWDASRQATFVERVIELFEIYWEEQFHGLSIDSFSDFVDSANIALQLFQNFDRNRTRQSNLATTDSFSEMNSLLQHVYKIYLWVKFFPGSEVDPETLHDDRQDFDTDVDSFSPEPHLEPARLLTQLSRLEAVRSNGRILSPANRPQLVDIKLLDRLPNPVHVQLKDPGTLVLPSGDISELPFTSDMRVREDGKTIGVYIRTSDAFLRGIKSATGDRPIDGLLEEGRQESNLCFVTAPHHEVPNSSPLAERIREGSAIIVTIDLNTRRLEIEWEESIVLALAMNAVNDAGIINYETLSSGALGLFPIFVPTRPRDRHSNTPSKTWKPIDFSEMLKGNERRSMRVLAFYIFQDYDAEQYFRWFPNRPHEQYNKSVIHVLVRYRGNAEYGTRHKMGPGRKRTIAAMIADSLKLPRYFVCDDDVNQLYEFQGGAIRDWVHHANAAPRAFLFMQRVLDQTMTNIEVNFTDNENIQAKLKIISRVFTRVRISDSNRTSMEAIQNHIGEVLNQFAYSSPLNVVKVKLGLLHCVELADNFLRRYLNTTATLADRVQVQSALDDIDLVVQRVKAAFDLDKLTHVGDVSLYNKHGNRHQQEKRNRLTGITGGVASTHTVSLGRYAILLYNRFAIKSIHQVSDNALFIPPLDDTERHRLIAIVKNLGNLKWSDNLDAIKMAREGYKHEDMAHVRYLLRNAVSGFVVFAYSFSTAGRSVSDAVGTESSVNESDCEDP